MLNKRILSKCKPLVRLLSTSPPKGPLSSTSPGLRPAGPGSGTKGGTGGGTGGGGGALLTAGVMTIAGGIFVAYKLEADPDFKSLVEKNVPMAVDVLSPVRVAMNSLGVGGKDVNKVVETMEEAQQKTVTTTKSETTATSTEPKAELEQRHTSAPTPVEIEPKSDIGSEPEPKAEPTEQVLVEEQAQKKSTCGNPSCTCGPSCTCVDCECGKTAEKKSASTNVQPLFHKRDIKHEDEAEAEKAAAPYVAAIPVIDYTKVRRSLQSHDPFQI